MYGNNQLNHHNILRYGLTIDFCQSFRSLKYLDIELPMTLIRQFHVYIKDFVDSNLSNTEYIKKLQKKYNIQTIRDVQIALKRKPKLARDLSKAPNRNIILMPAALAAFALDQFPNDPILLMVTNHYDKAALKGKKLPKNFIKFSFSRAISRVKVPIEDIRNLKIKLEKILSTVKHHELFGTPEFQLWINRNLISSIKGIYLFDHLIKRLPIALILDHIEIAIPGNILSLLALKYNLPFINAPQLVITDRTIIPTRASHYFVWGNNYKKWLEKRGIPSSKIKITGNLRFEYENQGKHLSKAEFIKQLNIPSNHLIITFTAQNFPAIVNLKIMDWITKTYNKLPITFIIKPHPVEAFDYTNFLQKSRIILAPKHFRLYDILINSDFIMTISSTTAIEAAMLKKGIIILQPELPYHYELNNNDFNAFLVKSGAGIAIYDHQELKVNLKKLVEDKGFRDKIINQGQQFLSDTLDLKHSSSTVIRKLILSNIKDI